MTAPAPLPPRPEALEARRRPSWRGAVVITLVAGLLVWSSRYVMEWDKMFADFICYWTAGKLLSERESPYDAERQTQVQKEYGWVKERDGLGIYDYLPFYYPPWFGFLFVPLLPLGYDGARTAWFFLNVEGTLLAGYFLGGIVPRVPRPLPVVLAPLFLFCLASILMGQTAVFVFLVLALAWRLLETGRDRGAGVTLAWLSVKPQLTAVLLLGLFVWLVRRRRWRVVGWFFLTLGLLAAGSALVVPAWPLQMLNAILDTSPPTKYFPWIGNAWLLVLRSLGLDGPLLWVAYLGLALPLLAGVLWTAWSPTGRLDDLLCLGILAAFFVAPYARHYDFPVLLIPLLVVAGRLPRAAELTLVFVMVCAPYVQLFQLARYKEQHPADLFVVESTYFWVPLLLAGVWALAARGGKRAGAGA